MSGKPPAAAILLSTDTFTLADEDAIVPIDNFVKTDEDRAWMKSFFPAFMLNSQFGNKTWGVPFQRSIKLFLLLEQRSLQGSRARPEQTAQNLGRNGQHGPEADPERRLG